MPDRPDPAPSAFAAAAVSLRRGPRRPEVVVAEAPAPSRLAPYAVALTADVLVQGQELATGRLVLLHDPAGHETWQGVFRLVTYLRAELEPEMAVDPLLPAVGWSWLLEALAQSAAGFVEPSGTVTRAASDSFGAMAGRPPSAEVEIRASWTPLDADLGPHLHAWCEVLCTAAGLPPLTPVPPLAAPPLTAAAPTARDGRTRVVPFLPDRGRPPGR